MQDETQLQTVICTVGSTTQTRAMGFSRNHPYGRPSRNRRSFPIVPSQSLEGDWDAYLDEDSWASED